MQSTVIKVVIKVLRRIAIERNRLPLFLNRWVSIHEGHVAATSRVLTGNFPQLKIAAPRRQPSWANSDQRTLKGPIFVSLLVPSNIYLINWKYTDKMTKIYRRPTVFLRIVVAANIKNNWFWVRLPYSRAASRLQLKIHEIIVCQYR